MPLRNGLRARDINIALKKQGELPWISIFCEDIEVNEDHQIVAVTPNVRQIIRRADQLAPLMANFVDPVTGQEHTVSGAGAQELIRLLAVKLMAEEFGTVYDPMVGKAMFVE